jgi:predicted nucleic acid-binding protein
MRVVLDTNILVSSALGGALELILDKMKCLKMYERDN